MALSKITNSGIGAIDTLSVDTDTLVVDSTNNRVGIGTNSPDNKLTIGDSSSIVVGKQWGLDFQDTGKGEPQAFIYAEGRYDANYNIDLIFGTIGTSGSATERMRIDSSGNVLVGGSSPIETFASIPTIQGVDNCIIVNKRNTTLAASQIRFHNPNGTVGSINTSGTSTSYVTSSDYRLKENVVADWDATTRLKQLNPVRFNFIADPDKTVDGFLAHEVQDIVPEAISGTHNEVDDEGNPVYQGIDQSKLTPLLAKALIEAVEKIEQLEARIAALENA